MGSASGCVSGVSDCDCDCDGNSEARPGSGSGSVFDAVASSATDAASTSGPGDALDGRDRDGDIRWSDDAGGDGDEARRPGADADEDDKSPGPGPEPEPEPEPGSVFVSARACGGASGATESVCSRRRVRRVADFIPSAPTSRSHVADVPSAKCRVMPPGGVSACTSGSLVEGEGAGGCALGWVRVYDTSRLEKCAHEDDMRFAKTCWKSARCRVRTPTGHGRRSTRRAGKLSVN